MRVAVTGAAGRLGRALIAALEDAPFTGPAGPIAWDRSAFDLDAPDGIEERLVRDRAEVVVHAAAWTDVDGVRPGSRAGDPAERDGHGGARARLRETGRRPARHLDERGVRRPPDHGRATGPATRPTPGNPYGASKAEGRAAGGGRVRRRRPAPASASPGRPGCSARRAAIFRAGSSMPPSEPGTPASRCARSATSGGRRATPRTWPTPIVELLAEDALAGIHHLVNGLTRRPGPTGRATSIARAAIDVEVVNVPMSTWERPSRPPRWGVLEPTPLPSGEPMRAWRDAMADYAPVTPAREARPGAARMTAGARPAAFHAAGRPSTAGSTATPTSEARSANCGATKRSRASGSSRRTFRPRRPASCAGCISIAARQTCGSLPRGARTSPSWTSGRCSKRPGRRPIVETRELGRGRVGPDPDGRGPRLPRPRTAPARLLGDQPVRRHRRARFRVGRPRASGCRGRRWMRPRTVARSCPPRDTSNPSLRDLVDGLRTAEA